MYQQARETIKGKSFAKLKEEAAISSLFFEGQKVALDPFSRLKFFIELVWLSPSQAEFRPHLQLKELQIPFSQTSWVEDGSIVWALYGGIIRSFEEEVPSEWIKGDQTLQGDRLFQAIHALKKEGIEIREVDREKAKGPAPFPFLVLTDRHGAFANLFFDYGELGVCASHDPSVSSWRSKEDERHFENDLLETSFCKKQVGESNYYCPLDQVVKSLLFLLEIGWKVIDCQQREVVCQKGVELLPLIKEAGIHIRGKVQYGKSSLEIRNVVGAFTRQERFIELSVSEVALIDAEALRKQGLDFKDEEVTEEGIFIPSCRRGVLSTLLDNPRLQIQDDVKTRLLALLTPDPKTVVIPGSTFQGTLFPYQIQGLQWLSFLYQGSLGGVLADEMGLGKTVQLLAFFSSLSFSQPILIVTPTSLLFNWAREIEKFLPGVLVYRHEGTERVKTRKELQAHPIILTSYALLRQETGLFQQLEFELIVLDEAQAIKNPESQISLAAASLQARMRIAVTGTPVENRSDDLWALFRFVQPQVLQEQKKFQDEILLSHSNPFLQKKIRNKIRPFLLRRTKKEVVLDLPEKIEQITLVEMKEKERALYDSCLQKTKQGVLKQIGKEGLSLHKMEVLEAILRLRQICDHPALSPEGFQEEGGAKWDRVFADLEEVVAEGSKVILFSQFTKMLKLLEKEVQVRGWGYVYLDGSTKDREEVVRKFQEDEGVSIGLMSLKAGGVGLNLTAADYVFLYEPWWNEAIERQAIDRAHRLGRKSPVMARRYITALSIEEKMMRLKEHKKDLAEALIEGAEGGMPSLSFEEILALLD